MRACVALGLAGFVFGCAGVPRMTALDLAGRAQNNMIEAQQNLGGRLLVVSGVVKETALTSRSKVQITRDQGLGVASYSATATEVQEQMPVVVLQPGSVLCYFEPADIGEAANLRGGDAVSLECEVQYFKTVQQMAVSVLGACRRRGP